MDHQWLLGLAKIYFRFVVVVGEMAVTEFVTSAGSTTTEVYHRNSSLYFALASFPL